MAPQTYDAALDFLPEAQRQSLWLKVRDTWQAVVQGARAAHDYQALTQRGMARDKAADAVFERHFRGR